MLIDYKTPHEFAVHGLTLQIKAYRFNSFSKQTNSDIFVTVNIIISSIITKTIIRYVSVILKLNIAGEKKFTNRELCIVLRQISNDNLKTQTSFLIDFNHDKK